MTELILFESSTPEDWATYKIAHGFGRIGSGTTPKSDRLEYYDGDIPWITTSELRENLISEPRQMVTQKAMRDYSVLKYYPEGTLLIALYGATIGRMAILGIPATVNQACCALSEPTKFDTKFVYYWLWAFRPNLISLSSGGGQPNLSQEIIKSIRIPCPGIKLQQKIAGHLDHKITQIDTLIAKKRRQIELIKEKRTALIHEAIQEAGTADIRIRHVADSIRRPLSRVSNNLYTPVGLYNRARGIFHKDETYGKELGDSGFFWLKPDDLVLSGQFAWEGAVAFADEADAGCIASHRYHVLRGKPQILDTAYLYAYFTTVTGDFTLNDHSRGAAGRNRPLNIGSLLKEKIPVPPIQAQRKVSNLVYFEREFRRAIDSSIQLLDEYRSSLITDVVSGKLPIGDL